MPIGFLWTKITRNFFIGKPNKFHMDPVMKFIPTHNLNACLTEASGIVSVSNW